MNDISVIVPLYNERESLPQLYKELISELTGLAPRYELIFVDDGSHDGSLDVLESLQKTDDKIKIVSFRRNFGKAAALSAGFKRARGDVIVTMDADLQDRPHEIKKLLGKIESGWDLVSGWRIRRADPWRKRTASRIFNKVTSLLTGVRIHDINCGLKAYRRRVIEEIRVYGEMHRYIPVLASYRGFAVGEVEVKHQGRRHGKSKYGIGRMAEGMFDLLTVIMLTRYNSKPLHAFGILGILLLSAGFSILGFLSVGWYFDEPIAGRPLFSLGILLMIMGVQFIFFGLLAEMIAYATRSEDDYSIQRELDRTDHGERPRPVHRAGAS